MSLVHLRDLGFQRYQPEEREGLSRTRRPGRRHLGHSGGWQDTEETHTHSSIPFSIQQEPQTRGLERYGSSSSAPPTLQRFLSMEHGQEEAHKEQAKSALQWLHTIQKPTDQWPRVTILHKPRKLWEKTRIKGQKHIHLQPKEERVRPNYPEAVGFGERSAQESEVAVNSSRISSPLNRNINPTQIDHNVVTPESNLNSDSLWLQMSQYAEQIQKQFAELEEIHERIKKLTASMNKIVKTLQEEHSQLSKASEETNKRLNLVFEEQNHRKRDRDCLDQDINKLLNVYHSLNPQPQGHLMDIPYQQDDIKPDAIFMNKARSPSPYQD
ncbi:hypothetical protein O181_009414 [Austropuccinia psidii MF-1]|uniref:Uncharacterized protein n=1 Tax=Austropuccinia psidii MF-1 TaxID=1389203 RepID=A0A9Q3BQS5_9BASI|nr:hypothetical protein [Austropuccinia psidii MF-1]